MVDFPRRTAIRSSETGQAEDKNSEIEKQSHRQPCVQITLVLEVASKPGPLQTKGPAPRFDPSRTVTHPAHADELAENVSSVADSVPDFPAGVRIEPTGEEQGRKEARRQESPPFAKTAKGRAPSSPWPRWSGDGAVRAVASLKKKGWATCRR